MAKALSVEGRVAQVRGITRERTQRALDLYPGLITSFVIAWRNSRERWRISSAQADVGRRTGARC